MIEMPPRIAALEQRRGVPIPWFVNRPADGTIDFRVMHPVHYAQALRQRLCWICGQSLGRYMALLGGPLSVAQRRFFDPPSHRECAEYAVQVCPFMATPMERRDGDLPPVTTVSAALENPGMFGMLVTTSVSVEVPTLLAGRPREIIWYTGGRLATCAEVETAIAMARARDVVRNSPMRDTIYRMLDELPRP